MPVGSGMVPQKLHLKKETQLHFCEAKNIVKCMITFSLQTLMSVKPLEYVKRTRNALTQLEITTAPANLASNLTTWIQLEVERFTPVRVSTT